MRHVEGSAHSNSVSLTPTFKKGVRDLIGSAKEGKLAICSVKVGLIRGRAEARESGNTYSKFFTACLHPNAISKRIELGHPTKSPLKDLFQRFKVVMDFAMFFLIAWM